MRKWEKGRGEMEGRKREGKGEGEERERGKREGSKGERKGEGN